MMEEEKFNNYENALNANYTIDEHTDIELDHKPPNTFKEKMKNLSHVLIGLVIFIAFLLIPVFFIVGGIKLGAILIPWLYNLSYLSFAVGLVILLPMGIFKKTRAFSGFCLCISSYIYGLTLWFLGLLLTYGIWGMLGVIIGLFIMGVGVVPVALLATLLNGIWGNFWGLLILLFLTFGSRVLGFVWMGSE